mmetsp:Transcript_57548/g.64266  ORF Transcript_57548/g.64266 Transcript_57548/m.64266 type:complete len:167 (+) Transcript_57548:765-1265(+)
MPMRTFLSSIKIKLSVGVSKLWLISARFFQEANDVLTQCGTDYHAALQLFHLQYHLIHFLFQINESKVVPVQGNKTFADHVSEYNLYFINRALILNQKSDINDKFTQDMFISNMKRCDDVRNIVAVERHSQHDYIANRYKAGYFLNSIAKLWLSLPATSNASGQSF